jgi:hypothetical protein
VFFSNKVVPLAMGALPFLWADIKLGAYANQSRLLFG